MTTILKHQPIFLQVNVNCLLDDSRLKFKCTFILYTLVHLLLVHDSLREEHFTNILHLRCLNQRRYKSHTIIMRGDSRMMKASQFLLLSFQLIIQSLLRILQLIQFFPQEKYLQLSLGFLVSEVYLVLEVFLQEDIHRSLFNLGFIMLSFVVSRMLNIVVAICYEFLSSLIKLSETRQQPFKLTFQVRICYS